MLTTKTLQFSCLIGMFLFLSACASMTENANLPHQEEYIEVEFYQLEQISPAPTEAIIKKPKKTTSAPTEAKIKK